MAKLSIPTKFTPGDRVWCMAENKVYDGVVKTISINVNVKGDTIFADIRYQLSTLTISVPENKLFESKKALLASL